MVRAYTIARVPLRSSHPLIKLPLLAAACYWLTYLLTYLPTYLLAYLLTYLLVPPPKHIRTLAHTLTLTPPSWLLSIIYAHWHTHTHAYTSLLAAFHHIRTLAHTHSRLHLPLGCFPSYTHTGTHTLTLTPPSWLLSIIYAHWHTHTHAYTSLLAAFHHYSCTCHCMQALHGADPPWWSSGAVSRSCPLSLAPAA